MNTTWMRLAACREVPLLFIAAEDEPAAARQAREAEAKTVCSGCPVRLTCLEYRLGRPRQLDDVIWGGMDGGERNAELRRRRRAIRKAAAA